MIRKSAKLLLSFILLAVMSTECTSGGIDFKIYAVKYGRSMFQKKFIFFGDKSGASAPFSWMFYYIEYGDKKILIDTGFNDQKMVSAFGITGFKDPVAILEDNGINPNRITDVIITHSHFDHIGNANRFKNARFIISKDELAILNSGKSLVEVKKFFTSNSNVTSFDESTVLYDKFKIQKIGGHTKGSSVVFFSQGDREYCFTGDEVYLRENIEQNTGNGTVTNHKNNLEFISMLRVKKPVLFIFHDNSFADLKKSFIKVFPEK